MGKTEEKEKEKCIGPMKILAYLPSIYEGLLYAWALCIAWGMQT